MSLQGGLSIERMCQLGEVSKAGFYRHLRSQDSYDEELHVRSEIQNVALEHHELYGYRRITAELRRRGMLVNHKRVARIMRDDDLLARSARWSKKYRSRDTVQVNLAAHMNLTSTDQLWVADITHVRVKRVFVYLAVVLDRFSRRVVGWALGRTLTSRLPMAALSRALEERTPSPGLVHHSDRGPQYVHAGYLRTLRKHGILPSVSRPGRPGDNANCESFFHTLRREEIHAKEYRDLADLHINISRFIEMYYNERRLHSALGYQSPAEFEHTRQSCGETGRERPDGNCLASRDLLEVSRDDRRSEGFIEPISACPK